MSLLNIRVEGAERSVAAGTTGFELFASPEVVAITVNGDARDKAAAVADGDQVDPVMIGSELGLSILRHSTAHIMAQAVQQLYDKAKLGIGPPIKDGFYFDFDVDPFTPEDLERIEKRMRDLIKSGQRFSRREVSEAEARKLMVDEPYKLELIDIKGSGDVGDGAAEVGEGSLSVYENLDRNGEVVWRDLCRGPHLPNTKPISKNFKLLRSAAAYWRGNEQNKQLQRIYGTAWPSTEALEAHLHQLEEAQRRDHRRIGVDLDLFSFPDEIGSGLAVFHPKGGVVRRVMEDYSRQRHQEAGYEFVYSPHITKSQLFETSGHLQWYSEGMFPPMQLDAEHNEDGSIRKPGQDYYLKPMNCPFHILIFKSRSRSYRELPLRMFEFGTVYRYEKSGVVHGLTRVRGLTQDDAHLFVTQEQLEVELTSVLQFVLGLLRDYGLTDFYLELSTKSEKGKFVGSHAAWQSATETLERVAKASNLELVPDPGGAAFYGPKISVQARDAIGRTWQMSTIQLDFNLPERFDLEYVGSDGERHRPIMIHRALFGSIERFFAVLTEHYAGHFPPWLAPLQVVGIPVASDYAGFLHDIADELRAKGVRVSVDESDARMQKKIRDHTLDRVPFMLLAGERDASANTVSFRFRDGTQRNDVPRAEAIKEILAIIENREQV